MLIAIIRGGKGVLHLAGALDRYNLELLAEHAASIFRTSGNAEVRITADFDDETALFDDKERWLERLTNSGVAVSIVTKPENDSAHGRQPSRGRAFAQPLLGGAGKLG